MASSTASPESKERQALMNKAKRLHGSIDRLRCDEVIQREGLDFQMDRMLDLCDEVIAAIPEVVPLREAA